MYWTRSGDLIIMVVLGGMGTVAGPLMGTIAFLVLEEILPGIIKFIGLPFVGAATAGRASEYWMIVMGPLLLLVVLFARGGIDGLLMKLDERIGLRRPQ